MRNTIGEAIDETLLDKINNLIGGSSEIVSKFIENPLNVSKTEVQKTIENHSDIARREKAAFYKEMVENALPKSK